MICSPQVKTGFSEVIGSWKIIEISLPRIARISRSDSLEQVAALEHDRAADDPAGGWGTSRRIESAVTLLPLPDSPTTASVWPACTSNETPSTARTTPASPKKCVWRFSDPQQRFGAHDLLPVTRLGSSASRSPSPRKLKAITVRKIASPGT